MSTAKTCSRCQAMKALEDFPKNASSPDGHYSRCKVCTKEAKAAYRQRDDVKAREAERLRLSYLNNREAKLIERRARYASNKDATLGQNRQWRQANLERHRALCRKWAKDHPEEMRAIVARRRALVLGADGSHTKADVERLFAEQDGYCLGCAGDLAELGYHVDHIHPLSKGGSNGPENLQLLCPTCNRQKSDKTDWKPHGS